MRLILASIELNNDFYAKYQLLLCFVTWKHTRYQIKLRLSRSIESKRYEKRKRNAKCKEGNNEAIETENEQTDEVKEKSTSRGEDNPG